MKLKYFLFSATFALVQGISFPTGYDLKYVHVIMRVGEHTPPEDLFKNVKYADLTKNDFSTLNMLLPTGAVTMYNNGLALFQTYGSALKVRKGKLKDFVEVSSLDSKFAKESVAVAYEGMNEQDSILKKIGKAELDMKTLKIPYVENMIEDITMAYYPEKCPYFHKVLENTLNTWPVFEKRSALNNLKDQVPNFPTDIKQVYMLYELNKMYMSDKGTTKNWFTPGAQKIMHAFSEKFHKKAFPSTTLKRLGAGQYLSHIVEEIDGVISGKNTKKMLIFATPDLAPKVGSMGTNKGYKDEKGFDYANFGAMFIVEFYQKTKEKTYHIRLRYEQNGKSELNDEQVMIFKDCKDLCEFQKVKNIMKPVLLSKKDAGKECKDS